MSASVLPYNIPPTFTTNRPLFVALVVAIVFHLLVLLDLAFPKPPAERVNPDIDITIETPSPKVPEPSPFSAQQDQQAQMQAITAKPTPPQQKSVPKAASVPKPAPQHAAKAPAKPMQRVPDTKPKQHVKEPAKVVKPVHQTQKVIETPTEHVKTVVETKPVINTQPKPIKAIPENSNIVNKLPGVESKSDPNAIVNRLPEPAKPAPVTETQSTTESTAKTTQPVPDMVPIGETVEPVQIRAAITVPGELEAILAPASVAQPTAAPATSELQPEPVAQSAPVPRESQPEPVAPSAFEQPVIPAATPKEELVPFISKEEEKDLAKVKAIEEEFQRNEAKKMVAQKNTPPPQSTSDNSHSETFNRLTASNLQQQISSAAHAAAAQPLSAPQTKTKSVNQLSANKSVAAQYKKDWETKVERIGNLNYPEVAAKPNFSATLTMDVGINVDGSIASMRITQSSGIPELDEAAKRIVLISAPFPHLPAALRKDLDVLLITRVWKFNDESGLVTQ